MTVLLGILPLIILFSLPAYPQPKIECRGLRPSNQNISIAINGEKQKENISKKDLVHGLSVLFADTSYKVIGFIVAYDCHSGSMIMDIHERTFYGNNIKANDPFLNGVWEGDMLVIECINLSKKGVKYIGEPKTFLVTD